MDQLIQTLKTIVVAVAFGFVSVGLSSVIPGSYVDAQNESADAACETLKVIDNSGSCEQESSTVNINSGLETALNLISFAAGVIAVVMIMVGGTRYITSQGDPGKVTQARNAIIYAAIGIVIVALAQVIVRFVLGVAASETPPTT